MPAKRNAYRLEKRYLRRDGSIVWCELSTSSIRDADGKRIGTIGVIADISERKRAEEALRDSEARLNSILAASPVGIAVLKDRKLTWVNDVGLKMFGYESNVEVVGQEYKIFFIHRRMNMNLREKNFTPLSMAIRFLRFLRDLKEKTAPYLTLT